MKHIESEILTTLRDHPQQRLSITDLSTRLGIDQSLVTAAGTELANKGLVKIEEEPYQELARAHEWKEKLPERLALEKISLVILSKPSSFRARQGEGISCPMFNTQKIPLSKLPEILNKEDARSEIKWLTRKGWFAREREGLTLTQKGRQALAGEMEPDELIVLILKQKPTITITELKEHLVGVDVERGIALLRGRDEIVRIKRRVVRWLVLTEKGIQEATSDRDKPALELTQLTPELLASGRWRDAVFRRYDVTLATKQKFPGKEHPLQRIIAEARRAFLEMGFEETSSPIVEIAFWDFDALFQPQDHPAREMQDTFYLSLPSQGRLPEKNTVNRIAMTHENGGDTGSKGWRYHWDQHKAAKLLLRTHTTAATIRALAHNPLPPRKVFCIGKVFRRENMDATHLPEFIQIDGIIIDEQASLVTLFGTLADFYAKMGARDVRFRPAYFPYTEPSVEVFAHLGRLGWVEMGGAGVFREEVTKPLGCPTRVLAWGLGLERLAMMRFEINDIRKLYWADINWLREAKLCR